MNINSVIAEYGEDVKTVYRIQIRNRGGEWRSIRPAGGEPYGYDTHKEAYRMLKMLYPYHMHIARVCEMLDQ